MCGHGVHLVRACAGAVAHVGAGDTLVCVGGLLDGNLLLVALAGAAADGEEPEEAGSEREGDSEPEHGKHLFSHASLVVSVGAGWLPSSLFQKDA